MAFAIKAQVGKKYLAGVRNAINKFHGSFVKQRMLVNVDP
jgi:hypothetical protein